MKNIFYLTLLTFISCNSANNYYQGRITDEKDYPLSDVTVAEENTSRQTKTDNNGYFKLDRSPDWIGNLIFMKAGYATDTIPAVFHQGGETTEYRFLTNDTTIVRMRLIDK